MKKTVVVAFTICLVVVFGASLASAAIGAWSIPVFINDYPSDANLPYWTEQVNGIAHDDGNWFFSTTDSKLPLVPCLLVKIPAGTDIASVTFPPLVDKGVHNLPDGVMVNWGMPDDLIAAGWSVPTPSDDGYYHYGDLDQTEGFLFVPIERGPPQAIAVFRASDLSYIGYHPTVYDPNSDVKQTSAGWVAYNPVDHYLYSSNEFIDSTQQNWLYRYTVDFNKLNNGNVTLGIQYKDRVELRNGDGSPLYPPIGFADQEGDVGYVQGGVFSPWGDLYITNGDNSHDPEYQHSGIHLFRLGGDGKYWRVADSVNGAEGFNFAQNTADFAEEPEGIDWWNVTIGQLEPPIATQLHAILLNTNGANWDYLYVKHYTVNYPPTAEAGDDQTVNEGDTVTLNGAFTDPDGPGPHTFLWHRESSTNGQVISNSATESLSFKPFDNGVYVFSFTVTDGLGAQGSDNVTVTSLNVPPVVNALYISDQPNSEFILPAVHSVYFKGEFSDNGTADTHTALWDWSDGTTSYGNVNETNGSGYVTRYHTYSLPGDYTVTLVVTDDDGGHGSRTMTVHVADTGEALSIFNAYIQGLDSSKFKNSADQRKNSLDNVFRSLNSMLAAEDYHGMIVSMNRNIREKFDGLVGGKANDDWIVQDLSTQTDLCQKVDDITEYLQYLLSTMP